MGRVGNVAAFVVMRMVMTARVGVFVIVWMMMFPIPS
jgi:hypothetical protein